MIRSLLWIDSIAGLLAGSFTLSLSGWLSRLYALPFELLVVMGIANVAYGTYSFTLARRARRPNVLLVILVVANATWAVLCAVTAVVFAPTASPLGLAQLLFEGVFVGGLAALEWRNRAALRVAS